MKIKTILIDENGKIVTDVRKAKTYEFFEYNNKKEIIKQGFGSFI